MENNKLKDDIRTLFASLILRTKIAPIESAIFDISSLLFMLRTGIYLRV